MTNRQEVIALYAKQVNGVHRYSTEDFYQLEAREKLFHLHPNGCALDFGCGAADLLAYYAPHFDAMVGVDISENMLALATERLRKMGVGNVTLQQADDQSVWQWLDERRFNVITSAGVMQYLSAQQIGQFFANARSHLESNGRIVMFDLIDPRVHWLVKYGWFSPRPLSMSSTLRAIARSAKVVASGMAKVFGLRSNADAMIGTAHHPAIIEREAIAAGFEIQFVRSMYYEYRYHALLTPKS